MEGERGANTIPCQKISMFSPHGHPQCSTRLAPKTPWALIQIFFGEREVNDEFVVRVHFCYCVCRAVVGAVLAVVGALSLSWLVAIVLCVAVDVAGGESVRKMFVLREKNVRRCCGRCASRCRPRCPRVQAATACVVLTVVVGVSLFFS